MKISEKKLDIALAKKCMSLPFHIAALHVHEEF